MLLKVEKRCQTTIEKILKSIVDERRSPDPLAERIYARRARAPGAKLRAILMASDRQGLPQQKAVHEHPVGSQRAAIKARHK